MPEYPQTIEGTVTGDAELRFTPNGKPVANFAVAVNHGHMDKQTNQWVKDGATFYQVTCWRHAEEIANRILKGTPVIVVGTVRNREYEARDGSKGRSLEVNASAVATLVLTPKGQQQGAGWSQHPPAQGSWQPGASVGGPDPWASQQQPTDPPF